MKIRLQKYLAEAGIASRRKAEEIILAGRVTVNGKTVKELGTQIDPSKDDIFVDKKSINAEKKVYFLLNKPREYTTTVSDPYAKHTVLELVKTEKRIFPVGRLDKDTTGLLILTNDGELAQKLTHPKYEKEKEYTVVCSRQLAASSIGKLKRGIPLDGTVTKPAKVRHLHPQSVNSSYTPRVPEKIFTYSIVITEGKKRQVRRMFEELGSPVLSLKRVRVDRLTLGDLKEGKWRKLSKVEVDNLHDKEHNVSRDDKDN